jgi:hypothetical protein
VDKSDDAVLDVVGLQAIDADMDRMDQVFANLLHGTWIPTRGGKQEWCGSSTGQRDGTS